MNQELKHKFLSLWEKYFGTSELPITFYYSDETGDAEIAEKPSGRSCLICELAKVRKGKSLAFSQEAVSCGGGKRFLGFTDKMRPNFEYFLSCGTAEMEGERYLRTPEQVKNFLAETPKSSISGKNIVFKRWDNLEESDNPDVVIFFAKPDVLAGLFTLANFDQPDSYGTVTPFGPGCGSIVYHPFQESKTDRQRAIIGMFDPSARPCVPADVLTFAVPFQRFEKMVNYMEESFLITKTWTIVKKRIDR